MINLLLTIWNLLLLLLITLLSLLSKLNEILYKSSFIFSPIIGAYNKIFIILISLSENISLLLLKFEKNNLYFDIKRYYVIMIIMD